MVRGISLCWKFKSVGVNIVTTVFKGFEESKVQLVAGVVE